jgi:hypothetical protein
MQGCTHAEGMTGVFFFKKTITAGSELPECSWYNHSFIVQYIPQNFLNP